MKKSFTLCELKKYFLLLLSIAERKSGGGGGKRVFFTDAVSALMYGRLKGILKLLYMILLGQRYTIIQFPNVFYFFCVQDDLALLTLPLRLAFAVGGKGKCAKCA